MRLLTDFRRDLVLGVRLLTRYRAFSAVSIGTLALTIGGNTAVFTIVNTLLLTPPPVLEPARLARVTPVKASRRGRSIKTSATASMFSRACPRIA